MCFFGGEREKKAASETLLLVLQNSMIPSGLSWEDLLHPLYQKYKNHITWGDQDLLNIIFHYNPGTVPFCRCIHAVHTEKTKRSCEFNSAVSHSSHYDVTYFTVNKPVYIMNVYQWTHVAVAIGGGRLSEAERVSSCSSQMWALSARSRWQSRRQHCRVERSVCFTCHRFELYTPEGHSHRFISAVLSCCSVFYKHLKTSKISSVQDLMEFKRELKMSGCFDSLCFVV